MSSVINSREENTMARGVIGPESEEIFRFLDLPPELRNRIYEYALVTDEEIRISRHRERKRGRFCFYGRIKTATRGPDNKNVQKYYAFKTAALLCTSKFVHEEANSVLYSSNRFTFENATVFQEMMLQNKRTVALLTEIEIHKAPAALNLYALRDATNLKRLHIEKIAVEGDTRNTAGTIIYGVTSHLGRRRDACKCRVSNQICLCISEADARAIVDMITVGLKGHQVMLEGGQTRPYGCDGDWESFKGKILDTWFGQMEDLKKIYKRVHGIEWSA